jgi:hypothetical protein
MTELRDKIEPSPMRSLASGSVVATGRPESLGWLIRNTGNVTLPFQRKDGSVVHIQPGGEAEV